MIQRTFHPVGQGAFYTERHLVNDDFINVVYDCGTSNVKKNISNKVAKSFNDGEVIHFLFISHFDFDHISLIDELKQTFKIEKVIIPLLHKDEKIFLANIFESLGKSNLAKLVANPNDYFGAETQIISVSPNSEEGLNDNPNDIEAITLTDECREIISGTPIRLNTVNDWVFIPYNHKYKDRNIEFITKLKENKIDIDKLKKQKCILDSEMEKLIKEIYKKISGNINENSMFLYSGPQNPHKLQRLIWTNKCCCGFLCWHVCNNYLLDCSRVACLYTGDGDLNKVSVKQIYKKYWNYIGTIQIPHHGSLPSFAKDVLENKDFFCPISVGKNNSYGHPSEVVICDILLHRSYPILVTEDVDSVFIETIECRC